MESDKRITRCLALGWLGLAFFPLRVVAFILRGLWPEVVAEQVGWSLVLGVEIVGNLGFLAGIGVLAMQFYQGRRMFAQGNWDTFFCLGLSVKGIGFVLDHSLGSLEDGPSLEYHIEALRIAVALVLVCTAIGMWLWVRRSGLQRTGGSRRAGTSGTPNPTRQ